MDNNVLPFILQHARELVEAQLPSTAKANTKIITPFPPDLNDFPGFAQEDLEFADPQTDADLKKNDTWNAFNFFNSTDNLFYDFSYGLKAPEYFLSQVCSNFIANSTYETSSSLFAESFKEMKDAFLQRYHRSTIGDLGSVDFYYTFPSQIKWYPRIKLSADEVERMKRKAIEVYNSIEQTPFLSALIGGINESNYNTIEYDLAYFDVNRKWVNPSLFENAEWKFKNGDEALYGPTDKNFAEGNAQLCYAQRYYVIKEYTGTVKSATVHTPASPLPARVLIRDHRTQMRNTQLIKKMALGPLSLSAAPTRAGFTWVNDHWERQKAGRPIVSTSVAVAAAPVTIFKVVAVLARIIPWKPAATAP